MTPFQAYELYIALKNHFTRESYDYLKYNGKTTLKATSFDGRNDKYQFAKLAKKENPLEFLIANFAANNSHVWIGELITDNRYEDIYLQWKKRKESLKYVFSKDLSTFDDDFDSNFLVTDGKYPKALKLMLANKISIETLCILNSLGSFLPYWNKKIDDQFLWKEYSMIIARYSPFLKFDKESYKQIVLEKFNDSE